MGIDIERLKTDPAYWDDLKSLLEDNIRGLYCYEDGKVRADVEGQVDAILSRYNLEPKK